MKYRIGDKVRVKSLEWYNENKDEFGDVKTPNNVFVPNMSRFCGQECIIEAASPKPNITYYGLKEDISGFSWTDDMFEGLAGSELNEPQDNEQSFKAVDDVDCVKPVVFENIVFPNENYADKVELCLGDDYEIVVEDGRTFVQRKKPKYPKTYEECCKVLDTDCTAILRPGYKYREIENFQKLIFCRDAYWKIAGKEMGLDKPWKQDYDDRCFIIANNNGNIHTYEYHGNNNVILAFPTVEMRDAFYENFKDLIEKCKELL